MTANVGSRAPDDEQMATLGRFAESRRQLDSTSLLLDTPPSLLQRAPIYMIAALVAVGLIVAVLGKVDVVVTASGRVESGNATVGVQALQGGIITRVLVAAGDRIRAGDMLMELDPREAGLDISDARSRLELNQADLERLVRAEAILRDVEADPQAVTVDRMSDLSQTGEAIDVVNALRSAVDQMALVLRRQEADLADRRRIVDSESDLLRKNITVLQRNKGTIDRMGRTARTELEARTSRLRALEGLAAKGIVNNLRLDEARMAEAQAQREINQYREQYDNVEIEISNKALRIAVLESGLADAERLHAGEVDRARTAFTQAQALVAGHREKLLARIATLRTDVIRQQSGLQTRERELELLKVTAPVSGVVTEITYPAPGARVQSGAGVATIVPDDAPPIVLATLDSKDVGFVREGTEARVKLDAYPYQTFGTVPAAVTSLFPVPGKSEFKVKLALEQGTIELDGRPAALFPGLTATVDLLTRRRPIYELFLDRAARRPAAARE